MDELASQTVSLNGEAGSSDHGLRRRRRALGGGTSSGIRSLLQQCDSRAPTAGHCTLLPILQCFDAPTALTLYVLEGHATVVSDLAFSAGGDELVTILTVKVRFFRSKLISR